MATIDDAKAAFDAYHQQVQDTISQLETELADAKAANAAGQQAVDAQPLLDDIAAAQQQLAPKPPADAGDGDGADAESTGEDAGESPAAAEAPAVDTSVKWNE